MKSPASGFARLSRCAVLLAFCGALASACGDDDHVSGAAPPWTVSSPDGQLGLSVEPTAAGELRYTVHHGGRTVVRPSTLGIVTRDQVYVSGLTFVSRRSAMIRETYRLSVGKQRRRTVGGNELGLRFRNPTGGEFELVARAHDDGVALRYRLLGDGMATVTREATAFSLPEDSAAFLTRYSGPSAAAGAYEAVPGAAPLGSRIAGGWGFPGLFEVPSAGAWVLISEADLDRNYCASRLNGLESRDGYAIEFPGDTDGPGALEPEAALPFETPWRVMIVGSLSTLVESSLVDDLSRPSRLADTDWLRPGRVAWSWLTQDTGDPPLQREYTDFAAELGWEHILVDEGWPRWPGVETEMPALVAYARARGVGVLLWYHSQDPKMADAAERRAELRRLNEWGIAGIKVDFFENDKQASIQHYLNILQDAADHRLMVNFHGATVPRGWRRTYPNLMTQEAVRGAEWYRSGLLSTPPPAAHVLYAFARNVVGSVDYTPLPFSAALRSVGETYTFQLALAVVFESGWQHFADRADHEPDAGFRAVFAQQPAVREFLQRIPTVWDETRLVAGHPRSHVLIARRSGADWYVGGINGTDAPLRVEARLPFLAAGPYAAQRISTGAQPSELVSATATIGREDPWVIDLAPRDGFAAVLSPDRAP